MTEKERQAYAEALAERFAAQTTATLRTFSASGKQLSASTITLRKAQAEARA